MCSHQPSCPSSDSRAAHIVAAHPEQGWSLRCDGAIVFDDSGELTADGRVVDPHRVPAERLAVAA
ncbi:DUF5999 family protein [Streptomyces sp. NPDC101209]|uniref:DUF5999 family protein n=1 Tax=unclassified Streptomyces TaxID=2593676 RepID=UPI00073ADD18|nr:DUF5999 family protein [Streptomyces sp. CdTB01]ALV32774.1 hypothetical protein AS200_12480 [Streptomyces sp. CdTB01]